MGEIFNFEDCPTLSIRLKREFELFHAIENEFKKTSENKKTYARGYERFKTRKIMKNLKQGIKIIEKKNPLYIEMPKLESVGNGAVKKTYDDSLVNRPDDEIEVFDPIDDNQIAGYIDNE